jgi:hypothetical protein
VHLVSEVCSVSDESRVYSEQSKATEERSVVLKEQTWADLHIAFIPAVLFQPANKTDSPLDASFHFFEPTLEFYFLTSNKHNDDKRKEIII